MGLATGLELFGQEDILTFCRNQNAERLLGAVAGVNEGVETLNLWVSNGLNLNLSQ